jgi:hypothetical protein
LLSFWNHNLVTNRETKENSGDSRYAAESRERVDTGTRWVLVEKLRRTRKISVEENPIWQANYSVFML